MRISLACAAMVVLVVGSAVAQELVAPPRDGVTDLTVIKFLGQRFDVALAKLGTPQIVVADRGATPDDDEVLINFGDIIIRVGKNQKIGSCFFRNTWNGSIRGVKIGDNREDIIRVLGKPHMTIKNKEGVLTGYAYRLPDLDVQLGTYFGTDGKLNRAEVCPK